MFKILVNKTLVKNSGEVSLTITIIESDDGVGKRVIPYGSNYIETHTIYAKNWGELDFKETILLSEIRRRINEVRENMKIVSTSKTIEY